MNCSVINGPIYMFMFKTFMKNHTFRFSVFKVNLLSFSHIFTLSNSLLIKIDMF